MFNVNGMPAVLVKNNRNDFNYHLSYYPYDDQDKQTENIIVCPYNVDQSVSFGVYSEGEATGYYILKNCVDVREGDELIFNNRRYSILKVKDNYIWNKLANFTVAVK